MIARANTYKNKSIFATILFGEIHRLADKSFYCYVLEQNSNNKKIYQQVKK